MKVTAVVAISDTGDWTVRGYPEADLQQLKQELVMETDGNSVALYVTTAEIPTPFESPLELLLEH